MAAAAAMETAATAQRVAVATSAAVAARKVASAAAASVMGDTTNEEQPRWPSSAGRSSCPSFSAPTEPLPPVDEAPPDAAELQQCGDATQ